MDIGDVELPPNIIQRFMAMGYKTLFPTQEAAIGTGFLEGKNIVVAVPTASGKSLIAYLAVSKCIEEGGKAVYIVPLKALAEEKYNDLKQLGFKAALSIGDYDSNDVWLRNYDVVVTTSEKCDSILRHEADLFDDVSLMVVDEVHLLHSVNRGPTLEVVMSRMRDRHIVALSATISNAKELGEWLEAELVLSDWRPIELKEGVFFGEGIQYSDGTLGDIEHMGDDTLSLALDGLENGGQVLVFVNSRRSTQSVAKKMAAQLKKRNIITKLKSTSDSDIGDKLTECIKNGAAFHHAGLSRGDRRLVEEEFLKGNLKVIVATPTLAAGINLPARRVVVRDWRRYDSNLGYIPISNLEIKQMMGRAGRPKFDKYGEAIVITKSNAQAKMVMEAYINSPTEKITSKLASEDALRSHVLSLCVPSNTREGIKEFFSKTFYSYQYGIDEVMKKVDRTIAYLHENDLLAEEDIISATPLGKRISELYIDPMSGVTLRNALKKEMTPLGMLHAICNTPDMQNFYLRKGDAEKYDAVACECHDEFLIEVPDSWYEPDDYEFFLSEIKTASILMDWISEVSERKICETYDIGPGDLTRTKDNAVWLSYAFKEIARTVGMPWQDISRLHQRLQHGIGIELLDLTKVKGIGRVRARKLYNLNIRNIGDLRKAPLERLERILGKKTALKVKQEAGIIVSEKRTIDSEKDSTLSD